MPCQQYSAVDSELARSPSVLELHLSLLPFPFLPVLHLYPIPDLSQQLNNLKLINSSTTTPAATQQNISFKSRSRQQNFSRLSRHTLNLSRQPAAEQSRIGSRAATPLVAIEVNATQMAFLF